MNEEQTNISAKTNGKKWGIIGAILLVSITLIVCISIYNTPVNRLSRQLDLGNRYLEEQNYEQAIVEFDKAIAIDPMSVEAYLGKADAYIGLGDLQSALDTLQTSYGLTGDERLKEELDEIEAQLNQVSQPEEALLPVEEVEAQEEQDYIELPFSVSDIKIMGYDLLEQHFDEIVAAAGYSINGQDNMYVDKYDDWRFSYEDDIEEIRMEDGGISHHVQSNLSYECRMNADYSNIHSIYLQMYAFGETNSAKGIMEQWCEVPLLPGDTYEDWCEKLGADMIKASSLVQIERLVCGDARYTIRQDNTEIVYEEYRCDEHNTLGGDSQFELSVYEFGKYDVDITGVFQNNTITWVTYQNFIRNIQ